jgi:hypothetical protein
MKLKVVILYVLAAALFLTACGSKTALTNEQFIEKMESAGYLIADATNQFAEGNVETVTLAMKDGVYQIEFYVLPSDDRAVAAFNASKNDFEQMKGSGSSTGEVNIGNHNYYGLSTGEGYYVVSRIDNTMIYINASAEYKDEIKDILKELGY